MPVIASLVVGADGSTSLNGTSTGLSTPEDRFRFLELHRGAQAIVIGTKTALRDPYTELSCPVYVLTRRDNTDLPIQFTIVHVPTDEDVINFFHRITELHTLNIVVESGFTLTSHLIALGLVDYLYLSITDIAGGENRIDINQLLSFFNIEEDNLINATRLLKCRYKGDSTDG